MNPSLRSSIMVLMLSLWLPQLTLAMPDDSRTSKSGWFKLWTRSSPGKPEAQALPPLESSDNDVAEILNFMNFDHPAFAELIFADSLDDIYFLLHARLGFQFPIHAGKRKMESFRRNHPGNDVDLFYTMQNIESEHEIKSQEEFEAFVVESLEKRNLNEPGIPIVRWKRWNSSYPGFVRTF